MVVPWICVSISKSQVIWGKPKKTVFCIFLCHSQNNFQVAANRTLSKIDALHIAHFEDYVPLFSKHMRKLAIPSKIWVWDPLKVSWSEFVQHKKAVFWPLFFRKILVLTHFDTTYPPPWYTSLESYGSQLSCRLAPTQQSWTCRPSDFW